jgi:predicted flap endonuclease-1-like 5' DNA nuclease
MNVEEQAASKKSRDASHSHQHSRTSSRKQSAAKPRMEEAKEHANEVYSRRPKSANSNATAISGFGYPIEKDLGITSEDLIFKKYV